MNDNGKLGESSKQDELLQLRSLCEALRCDRLVLREHGRDLLHLGKSVRSLADEAATEPRGSLAAEDLRDFEKHLARGIQELRAAQRVLEPWQGRLNALLDAAELEEQKTAGGGAR